jgi:hypothetical protein
MDAPTPCQDQNRDHEVSLAEILTAAEVQVLLRSLPAGPSCEMLLMGRNEQLIAIPREAQKVWNLPRPSADHLPSKPAIFKSADGNSSLGFPVVYKARPFALLLCSHAVLNEREMVNKIRLLAEIIESLVAKAFQQCLTGKEHNRSPEPDRKTENQIYRSSETSRSANHVQAQNY